MRSRVCFSSASDEWQTPQAVYAKLNHEFHFTLDPCAIDGVEDGLSSLFTPWTGHTVFVNPPYSRIRPWLERWRDALVAVYLIPSRTDCRWFHEIVLPHAKEIRFIRGRLRFGGSPNSAPFPSCIVILENGYAGPQRVIGVDLKE